MARSTDSGRVVLSIRDGALLLGCQHAHGYGIASQIEFDARASLVDVARELRE